MIDVAPLAPTLLVSLLGTQVVYWLRHARGVTGLRAAGLASLTFVGVAHLTGWPLLLALKPAFFGSTYCAMSEPYRLSKQMVRLSGLIFGLIYYAIRYFDVPYVRDGLGGTLGGSAFVACLFVYVIDRTRARITRT